MPLTICQCHGPGYCELMQRQMSALRHDQCRNKPGYFEAFLKDAGKPRPAPQNPETDWSQPTRCRHLGEAIETRTCNTCGDRKGTEYQIRECAVHGICSERKRDSRVECCLGCFEYEPIPPIPTSPKMPQDPEREIQSWAVGITTAPRSRHRTLPQCVASVIANGWNPVIFAEPGTDLSGLPAGLEIVRRKNRLGVWRNWRSAAGELMSVFPDRQMILTVQDDTVFHPQARWFAEHYFPSSTSGVFSFYTPRHYGQRADVIDGQGKVRKKNLPYESARKWLTRRRIRRGWKIRSYHKNVGLHKIRTHSLWGACALAFSPQILSRILNHKIAKNWLGARGKMDPKKWRERQRKEPWRIQNSDTAIGKILNALGYDFLCPVPSLADHIADASADGVNHGGRGGRRSAAWFPSEDLRVLFSDHIADVQYTEQSRKWWKPGRLRSTSLTRQCWREIHRRLSPGMRTLEFGSGLSTLLFRRQAGEHTAVESEPKIAAETGAVLSPLKENWYQTLPGGPYDLIFLDGPQGVHNRVGFLPELWRLCGEHTTIVIDDVQTPHGRHIAERTAEILNRPAPQTFGPPERQFAIVEASHAK